MGALAACAAFLSVIPSLHAQFPTGAQVVTAQNIISGHLTPGKTIYSANEATLQAAVVQSILDNPGGLTPEEITVAAFEPYPYDSTTDMPAANAKARADRNTSAGEIASEVSGQLIASGTDSTVASDVAGIVDGLVDLTGSNGKNGLSATGQEYTVRDVLQTLSNTALTSSSASTILAIDKSIGQTLASDPYLASLTVRKGTPPLTSLLTYAITGVNGTVKATRTMPIPSTVEAPAAAAQFAAGLIASGTVPNSTVYTPGTFAAQLISKVYTNYNLDELVANAFALQFTGTTNVITTGTAILAKYHSSSELIKITQGLVAGITPGTSTTTEYDRTTVAAGLATAQYKYAEYVNEGAVYVDPYAADELTRGVTGAVLGTTNGVKTLNSEAPSFATDLGEVLGADGDALTNVAAVFADLTGSNTLLPSQAGNYARDLINGALKGPYPLVATTGTTGGAGGKFNNGTFGGRSPVVLPEAPVDLASIGELLEDGIIKSFAGATTAKALTSEESDLTTLAKDIASETRNDVFTPAGGVSQPVAVFLAGNLIKYLEDLGGVYANTEFYDAIAKGVSEEVSGLIKTEVLATETVSNDSGYSPVGEITLQETVVTNL